MSAEAVKPKAAEPAATTWVGDDGVTKEELEALDLAKFPWLGKSLRSTLELAKNPLRRLLSDKIMTLATRNVKLEPMDDSNAAFPKLLEEVKKVAKVTGFLAAAAASSRPSLFSLPRPSPSGAQPGADGQGGDGRDGWQSSCGETSSPLYADDIRREQWT